MGRGGRRPRSRGRGAGGPARPASRTTRGPRWWWRTQSPRAWRWPAMASSTTVPAGSPGQAAWRRDGSRRATRTRRQCLEAGAEERIAGDRAGPVLPRAPFPQLQGPAVRILPAATGKDNELLNPHGADSVLLPPWPSRRRPSPARSWGRPGSPSGCPTRRQPSRRCGSTRRCSGPGPGRPSPGSTAPPPGSSTSPAGRGPDGVPAGPALPGAGPVLLPDPGNPRTAQGPFGEKSVIEFPGYQPPAWLDAAHRRPAATGMAVPSRVLGTRVPIEHWRSRGRPAAAPGCRCWSCTTVPSTPATRPARLPHRPCADGRLPPMRAACWPSRPQRALLGLPGLVAGLVSEVLPALQALAPARRGAATWSAWGPAWAPWPPWPPPAPPRQLAACSSSPAASSRPGPDDHERDFPASGGSPASSTTWPRGRRRRAGLGRPDLRHGRGEPARQPGRARRPGRPRLAGCAGQHPRRPQLGGLARYH